MLKVRRSKVKCKKCNTEGYNSDFYQVVTSNNKNTYYCDKHCYESMSDVELLKIEIRYFLIDILGNGNKSLKTYTDKYISEYESKNMLDSLRIVLSDRCDLLSRYLTNKEFPNNIIKAKYLFKMIEQSVIDEHETRTVKAKQQELMVVYEVDEMVKSTVKKRCDLSSWL